MSPCLCARWTFATVCALHACLSRINYQQRASQAPRTTRNLFAEIDVPRVSEQIQPITFRRLYWVMHRHLCAFIVMPRFRLQVHSNREQLVSFFFTVLE